PPATGLPGLKGPATRPQSGESLRGVMHDGTIAADADATSEVLDLLDVRRSILRRIEQQGGESCDGKQLQDTELIRRLTALQTASTEAGAGGEREQCAAPLAKPESGRSQDESETNKAEAHATFPDDARAQGR